MTCKSAIRPVISSSRSYDPLLHLISTPSLKLIRTLPSHPVEPFSSPFTHHNTPSWLRTISTLSITQWYTNKLDAVKAVLTRITTHSALLLSETSSHATTMPALIFARDNDALNVNPPPTGANHLTVHGSDWLWAVTAVFILSWVSPRIQCHLYSPEHYTN